jgi:hypothetical protein
MQKTKSRNNKQDVIKNTSCASPKLTASFLLCAAPAQRQQRQQVSASPLGPYFRAILPLAIKEPHYTGS